MKKTMVKCSITIDISTQISCREESCVFVGIQRKSFYYKLLEHKCLLYNATVKKLGFFFVFFSFFQPSWFFNAKVILVEESQWYYLTYS